jgi:hypothetical protein
MTDRLTRAIAEVLSSEERPLLAAARLVRRAFAVDRVSIARIDRRSARFEIAASARAELLAAGTTLPVSTCSYFAEVAEDRPFQDEDFDASRDFSRPLDEERLEGHQVDQFADVLRRASGDPPLLVLATPDTTEDRRAALRAGAAAYVGSATVLQHQ